VSLSFFLSLSTRCSLSLSFSFLRARAQSSLLLSSFPARSLSLSLSLSLYRLLRVISPRPFRRCILAWCREFCTTVRGGGSGSGSGGGGGGGGVRLPGDRRSRHNVARIRWPPGTLRSPYDRTRVWIAHGSRRTRRELLAPPDSLFSTRFASNAHRPSLPTLRTALPCWRKMAAPGRPSNSRAPPDGVVTGRERPNAADRARTLMAERRDATRRDATRRVRFVQRFAHGNGMLPHDAESQLVSRYHASRRLCIDDSSID